MNHMKVLVCKLIHIIFMVDIYLQLFTTNHCYILTPWQGTMCSDYAMLLSMLYAFFIINVI